MSQTNKISLRERIASGLEKWSNKTNSKKSEQASRFWKENPFSVYRTKAREMILNAFSNSEEEQTAEAIAWAIEQAVYDNHFLSSYEKYAQKVRLLARYICQRSSVFLTLDPCLVAGMTPQELNQIITEKESQKEEVEIPVITNEEHKNKLQQIMNTKSEHACRKCKSFETDYTTANTRSGDEGATVFFRCNNCGHKWRERG